MTTIHVSGLRKAYGAFDAVHDVTFTAAPGRVVGLLGPAGALTVRGHALEEAS